MFFSFVLKHASLKFDLMFGGNQVEMVIISLGNIFVFHRSYTTKTILNAYIHNKY